MKSFIEFNGKILDYKIYLKQICLLKSSLKEDLCELATKHDFFLKQIKETKYSNINLTFENQELDLELNIFLEKKSKDEFV